MNLKPINQNVGFVQGINGNMITIAVPRGGTFQCRAKGFKMGQAVCFVLDALGRQVLYVLPKDEADARWEAGQSEHDVPHDIDEEYFTEVIDNGDRDDPNNHNEGDQGFSNEVSIDLGCGELREDAVDPADYYGDVDQHDD